MLKNWKITAWLDSPLCGDPPSLDAVLGWELSFRTGSKYFKTMSRSVQLSTIEQLPIPLAKKTISGINIYCCSDPILPESYKEWEDRQVRRFDSSKNALMLKEKERKTLLVASGPYKQRFAPLRIRLVDRVVWFARCSKKETNKLLKSVMALGKGRHYGYGLIRHFDFDETDSDVSILTPHQGKNILMKTVPLKCAIDLNATGYRTGFGSWKIPYWHPENYTEIAKPC